MADFLGWSLSLVLLVSTVWIAPSVLAPRPAPSLPLDRLHSSLYLLLVFDHATTWFGLALYHAFQDLCITKNGSVPAGETPLGLSLVLSLDISLGDNL